MKQKHGRKKELYSTWCAVNSKVEAIIHPFIIRTRLAFYFLNAYVNKINLSKKARDLFLMCPVYEFRYINGAFCLTLFNSSSKKPKAPSISHVADKGNFHEIFPERYFYHVRTCKDEQSDRRRKLCSGFVNLWMFIIH